MTDALIALGLVTMLTLGFSYGWSARGKYEHRRAAEPTITFYERPPVKSNDSKL